MAKNKIYKLEKEFESSFLGPIHSEGVYAIVVIPMVNYKLQKDEARIMYIGSSQNVSKRVNNQSHPYYKLYNEFDNACVICYCKPTTTYKDDEIKAIKKYRPELNIQHNRA